MIGSYCPAAPDRKPHQWSKPQDLGQWSNGPAAPRCRGEVPLAETAGHVAVVAQDAGKSSTTLGLGGAVAGEGAGVLGDRTKADPVLVAAGEQCGAGR